MSGENKKDAEMKKRQEERLTKLREQAWDEKKQNEVSKKKAAEAMKLIDEFEQKNRDAAKAKKDGIEEKARDKRVDEVTNRGKDVL